MGVKVEGYLINNASAEDVYNFVLQVYDINATVSKGLTPVYELNDGLPKERTHIITFTYKGEVRDMRVMSNCRVNELRGIELENFGSNTGLYTFINLGKKGLAEEIITEIVGHFGGYIDRDDCDDIGLEIVDTNINSLVKPIKRLSLSDIYKEYGCLVVVGKE